MDVHDLTRDQLIELKHAYLCRGDEQPSWHDLACADEIVSDAEVFEEYAGVDFVPDDFFCSMEGEKDETGRTAERG